MIYVLLFPLNFLWEPYFSHFEARLTVSSLIYDQIGQVTYSESIYPLLQIISTIKIHKLSLEIIIIPHIYIVFTLHQRSFSSTTLFNLNFYYRFVKVRKACCCFLLH